MKTSVVLLLFLQFVLAQTDLTIVPESYLEPTNRSNSAVARPVPDPALESRFSHHSLNDLESRKREIDRELEALSPISLRTGVGAVGGRSEIRSESDCTEWFRIQLEQSVEIDQIVLVPMIWRDSRTGFCADGFPLDFRVVVGSAHDDTGTMVAEFTEDSRLLPRIAPLVIPCEMSGSWVRIEASRLTPRRWDSRYVFQLSEILIFSGQENVALHRPVHPSTKEAYQVRYLVDGFVPYLMDSSEGEPSLAYLVQNMAQSGVPRLPSLTIDLKSPQPINGIHLHSVELSDTVPQSNLDGFGFPKQMTVEGANEADFSDAAELFKLKTGGAVFNLGPIVMRKFPNTVCRFVRLTATEPDTYKRQGLLIPRLGFAEIEVFSSGKNIALAAPIEANFFGGAHRRPLSALTDGHNNYGKILTIRNWLNELALRHDLEVERPLIIAELNRRYATQSTRLVWVTCLAAFLAAGIVLTVFWNRVVRVRQMTEMKERFAADMHDELGANLHVIGILSDLAQEAVTADSREKACELNRRIRNMTERSGAAVRYCTNILDAKELYQDLYENMKRETMRIMADIEGELTFQGDKNVVEKLKPRTRADLFLFYKECLVNISRHSEASKFSASLTADEKEIGLIVCDNGIGFRNCHDDFVPLSLRRRARLLGAGVSISQPELGGVRISLQLPLGNWLGRI